MFTSEKSICALVQLSSLNMLLKVTTTLKTILPKKYMSIFNMFSDTFQCSSSCGYGQKSRDIWCVDLSRRNVSDALCNPESKPESSAACYGSNCPSQWKHGDWSPVSRLRNVHLIANLLRVLIDGGFSREKSLTLKQSNLFLDVV